MSAIAPSKIERAACAALGHAYIKLANGDDWQWCERCGYETWTRKYGATRAWNDYMDQHGPVSVSGSDMQIPMFSYQGQYRTGAIMLTTPPASEGRE